MRSTEPPLLLVQVNERRTKNKIAHAIELFKSLENYDAMAEILRRLPNE